MAIFRQVPASMNLILKKGDEAAVAVDFDTAIVGYTVTASMHSLVTQSTVQSIPATVTNAALGQVSLAFSETHTSIPAGSYGWSMQWVAPGSVTRTVMSGVAEIV